MNIQRERIRLLNRELLKDFSKGRVMITRGIDELGKGVVIEIVKAIASYDDFSESSDPHGENDFGSLEYDGHRVFFKIDYLDLALSMHSPDPGDPNVTVRVLTVMLAEEY